MARPYTQRQPISRPLVTGQRVIDTMFPLAKGGAAAVPGGFGTGKTMTQHQLAKWCDADIIVYIGCGERGNEMTQVLDEFSELIDPKSNRPLLDRTMLIANTSNMPVARVKQVFTQVLQSRSITEIWVMTLRLWLTQHHVGLRHFVKYRVVLKKCLRKKVSLLIWHHAYLRFHERAGMMHNLNGTDGSVSIIGAVSPQGGDFSEPVTQNTKRFVRCFLGA